MIKALKEMSESTAQKTPSNVSSFGDSNSDSITKTPNRNSYGSITKTAETSRYNSVRSGNSFSDGGMKLFIANPDVDSDSE